MEPIRTAPAVVATLLEGPITKATIAEAFGDHDPASLNFTGKVLDDAATEALGELLGKSMTVVSISLGGGGWFPLNALVAALPENLSVQRVDLSAAGLRVSDAKILAEKVLPWNRTVVEWNFTDNPGLADDGVAAILDAFVGSTLSVQRLSLRNCGLSDKGCDSALAKLNQLTGLYQVDLSGNPGWGQQHKKAADDLDSVLQRNLQLLHPNDVATLVPLIASLSPAAAEKPTDDKKAPATAARPRGTTTAASPRPRGATVKESPPPRARGSTVKNDSPSPTPRQRHGTIKRGPPPPVAAAKTDDARPAQEVAPTEKPADSAAPKPVAPTPQRDRSGAGASPAPKRAASASRATPTHSPHRSMTPSRHRLEQRPVGEDEALARMKKAKEEANQRIRAASPAASASERKEPPPLKYCLGKRVDKIKEGSSGVFRGPVNSTRMRDPTPAEIRKLAPWNLPPSESTPKTSWGQGHKVTIDEGAAGRPPTVLVFRDGGKQTYLDEDPRDIGYVAKKIQDGRAAPDGKLFRSNSPREVRWGVSPHDKSYVHRDAQAPDPGAYTVLSEWERNAKKYRELSRNTSASGKKMFGGSSAARPSTKPLVKDDARPGPGEYEIP